MHCCVIKDGCGERQVSEIRACNACGVWTWHGCHGPDGRFDQWSVFVSEKEIDQAISRHYDAKNSWRRNQALERRQTRYAIALGIHIGTYEVNE